MSQPHPATAPGVPAGPTFAPVFLVGCGRSGTSLLRLMLHAHPDLAIPPESHVVYKVGRKLAAGRWPSDLSTPGAWARLVEYLATAPDLDPWDVDRAVIRDRLGAVPERTYAAAFRTVFESYLDQYGGRRWGDKTPQHVQYMLVLDRLFPGAQFIHVTRDGRDVAMSLLRMKHWGPRRMAEAGYYWSWLVLSGIVAGEVLGPDRYRHIRYEDLVRDPESSLRSLAGWLGHAYDDAMLTYYDSDDARRYAEEAYQRRGGKRGTTHPATTPPDPGQLEKWRHNMSARDLRSFYRQAGGLLAYLGYEADGLPHSQLVFRRRLDDLVESGRLSALERQHRGRGPEAVRTAQLLATRAMQLGSLVAQRPAAFARASVRWQTTVADLITRP